MIFFEKLMATSVNAGFGPSVPRCLGTNSVEGEVVTQRTDEWLDDSITPLVCPARPMVVEGHGVSRHHRVFRAMSLI